MRACPLRKHSRKFTKTDFQRQTEPLTILPCFQGPHCTLIEGKCLVNVPSTFKVENSFVSYRACAPWRPGRVWVPPHPNMGFQLTAQRGNTISVRPGPSAKGQALHTPGSKAPCQAPRIEAIATMWPRQALKTRPSDQSCLPAQLGAGMQEHTFTHNQ